MADTTTLELTLFQHADGRSVAAQPGTAFLAGDPGWHRAFPVTVHVPADTGLARIHAAEDGLYDVAATFIALEAIGRALQGNGGQSNDQGDAIRRLAAAAHEQLLVLISELVG